MGHQYQSFDIPSAAPYLILAGDVGRLVDFSAYGQFLERTCAKFDTIFLVLGNHEFYGLTYDQGLARARDLVALETLDRKVVLLDQTVYHIPGTGVTLAGCTLWSHIPVEDEEAVRHRVKDYKQIAEWSTTLHNAAHSRELAWLMVQTRTIHRDDPSRSIIVVTHHAPCKQQTSRPEQSANPWSSAFASEAISTHVWPGVKIWLFGHTHYCTDFINGDIRVVANQRGYVVDPAKDQDSRRQINGFDIRKTLSLS